MPRRSEVPAGLVAAVRSLCLALPEAHEEQAWVGTRWRVRTRTFAHVVLVDDGWPPAYARASGLDGPVTLLTFRSAGLELETLRAVGLPFFGTPWRHDEVGLVLDDDVDWDEVTELLTDSYCIQAPRTLRQALDRPGDRPAD